MSNNKTFLVMGSYRGGTTAVTAALMGLGVNVVTDSINPLNLEDRPFFRLVHNVTKVDARLMEQYINKRNTQGIWAVKYPAMHKNIEQYIHLFNKPNLVMVFRDPIAVAQSEYDRKLTTNKREVIDRTISYYNAMLSIADRLPCPVYYVSFERLILHKRNIVEALNEWCGVNGDVGQGVRMVDYAGSYDRTQANCYEYLENIAGR